LARFSGASALRQQRIGHRHRRRGTRRCRFWRRAGISWAVDFEGLGEQRRLLDAGRGHRFGVVESSIMAA